MSEAKHTPGPWVRDGVQSEHLHDVVLGYDVPGAGSPVLVAFAYGDDDADGPGDISNHEAAANARLIAAAPDLLAALAGLAGPEADNPGKPDSATCAIFVPLGAMRAAWAAVAKAEGRPT